MAGHNILTLGATAADMNFVQQYKNLGVGLESDIDSSDECDGDEHGSASDDSNSDESDSDGNQSSSSELSNLNNAGMSGILLRQTVQLTCSFVCVADDHPRKCSRHAT